MAGQIRKGFFFYFGLFVLMLVAIFLVCVVIMIFNPGKSVLWMQYFTSNETNIITKTTDEETDINWTQVSNLEINCSYANVVVERNDNEKYTEDALYIVNNAKGFATSANAVKFDVSVKWEGSTLVVDVTEPEGFLYFNKTVNVILHVSSIGDDKGTRNFSNMNLKVNTESGDVDLGGTTITRDSAKTALKEVHVQTNSGDISVSDNFNTGALQLLSFNTESGTIFSSNKVSSENTGLLLGCDADLSTIKGAINLDALNVTGNLKLSCRNGSVTINSITATNGVNVLSCVNGNFVIDEINGDIEFVSSEDTIVSPCIVIGKVHGNFILSTKDNQGNPDVKVGQVDNFLSVLANKGKLVVDEARGQIEIVSDGSLSVNVAVSEQNNNLIAATTKSGAINLNFLGNVSEEGRDNEANSVAGVRVKTDSGNITLSFVNSAKFVADAYKNAEGEEEALPTDKIKITIAGVTINGQNPFSLNERESGRVGSIEISTNSNVEYKVAA